MKSFSDLSLSQSLCRQLQNVGITSPTPIQEHCIPEVLAGKDVIGVAKTGRGKTLAFALPILERLSEDPYGIFAVIVTPTRELAYQIGDTFNVVGKAMSLRCVVVVGGVKMIEQGQELARKPHIVVATPGRLLDHLNSCDTFHFKRIKYLVLDEADKLLGGPYDNEIQGIFSSLPKNKQILMFSATMTDTLDKVKAVARKEVFLWQEDAEVATVDQLEQYYVLCPAYVKDGYVVEVLRRFLAKHKNTSIILFTDTCKNCHLLSVTLNIVGFKNVPLHKMMPQKERLNSLSKFKSDCVPLLVATDVASRGLDIPAVELVLNYNVPQVPKDYIHRVGRTARAGRKGYAISIVTPEEITLLQAIEEKINTKLIEFPVSNKEVAKIFVQISITKRECEIELEQSDFYVRKAINKRKDLILNGKDPSEIEKRIMKKIKEKKKLNAEMKKKRKLLAAQAKETNETTGKN